MENRKRFTWNDKEVSVLLGIWEANIENLRAAKRNSHVYKKMQNEMLESRIKCDISDISNKIKNLSQKYRFEKKFLDSSGTLSDWKWFDAVGRILTENPERSLNLKKESTKDTTDDTGIYYFPEDIKCEVNSEVASCESNHSVSLQLSPTCEPAEKRSRLDSFNQEMLDEMRKINQIEEERNKQNKQFYELSAEFMKKSLANQEQANKMSEHSIALAKENLELQKLILKAILKTE